MVNNQKIKHFLLKSYLPVTGVDDRANCRKEVSAGLPNKLPAFKAAMFLCLTTKIIFDTYELCFIELISHYIDLDSNKFYSEYL